MICGGLLASMCHDEMVVNNDNITSITVAVFTVTSIRIGRNLHFTVIVIVMVKSRAWGFER